MAGLVLLTGTALAVTDGRREGTAPLPAMTRYDALVEGLGTASDALRREFAQAALTALIDAHAIELQRDAGGGAPWLRGARAYMDRLVRIREQLARGAPLEVVREALHAVRLIVGDEQVMLSAPRDGAQREFETGIAELLCTERLCASAAPTVDEVVVTRERALRGSWTLADREPPLYAQDDGLHCVFEDMQHLRLKQQACERLTREVRLLEEALRAVLQHGGRIDWQALRVGAPGRAARAGDAATGRHVSYAADGRYFELDLPLLAAAPAVVQGAIPWLQTRLRGQEAIYVITAPERLAYRVPETD